MTHEELAGLITARTTSLCDHLDAKLSALQAHIHGKLMSMKSDMLDLRPDLLRLHDAVNVQATVLDARR